jgi:H+-transporting ATPase
MATTGRLVRFIPFDPATRTSEAFTIDGEGRHVRIVEGAFEAISRVAEVPAVSGTLMQPLPWQLLAEVLIAAAVFALVLDQIKLPIIRAFRVE